MIGNDYAVQQTRLLLEKLLDIAPIEIHIKLDLQVNCNNIALPSNYRTRFNKFQK